MPGESTSFWLAAKLFSSHLSGRMAEGNSSDLQSIAYIRYITLKIVSVGQLLIRVPGYVSWQTLIYTFQIPCFWKKPVHVWSNAETYPLFQYHKQYERNLTFFFKSLELHYEAVGVEAWKLIVKIWVDFIFILQAGKLSYMRLAEEGCWRIAQRHSTAGSQFILQSLAAASSRWWPKYLLGSQAMLLLAALPAPTLTEGTWAGVCFFLTTSGTEDSLHLSLHKVRYSSGYFREKKNKPGSLKNFCRCHWVCPFCVSCKITQTDPQKIQFSLCCTINNTWATKKSDAITNTIK